MHPLRVSVLIRLRNGLKRNNQLSSVLNRYQLLFPLPLSDIHIACFKNRMIRMQDATYDFNCSEAEDMLLPEMAKRTNYLKTNEAEVENMCRQMQEIKARGRAEGRTEGRVEGIAEGIPIGELRKAKEIVLNLIALQKDMSAEQLASIAGVSDDQIKEWIE